MCYLASWTGLERFGEVEKLCFFDRLTSYLALLFCNVQVLCYLKTKNCATKVRFYDEQCCPRIERIFRSEFSKSNVQTKWLQDNDDEKATTTKSTLTAYNSHISYFHGAAIHVQLRQTRCHVSKNVIKIISNGKPDNEAANGMEKQWKKERKNSQPVLWIICLTQIKANNINAFFLFKTIP